MNVPAPAGRDHRTDPEPPDDRYDDRVRVTRQARLPRAMLPLKLDLGAAGVDTSRGLASGIGGSLGIHWSSLAPRPTDLDVGIGVFGSLMAARAEPSMMEGTNQVDLLGVYLELGHVLSRGRSWRTWASGRGEYLGSTAFGSDVHTGFGASARLTAELYTSAAVAGRSGTFLGTWAIGVYAEAAMRDTVMNAGGLHAGVGMTVRTPLVLAP